MSFFDSVKNMFTVDYDDDYEDDYLDDGYEDADEEYEKPQRTSFRSRSTVKTSEDDSDYEKPIKSPKPKKKSFLSSRKPKASKKIIPLRQSGNTSFEVCVIKPNDYSNAKDVADNLLANKAVVLNFEGVNLNLAQRIIDFVGGSTYSIDGNLQRVSGNIYLVTPPTIDITGDLMDFAFESNQKAAQYGSTMSTSTYNRPNY